MTERSPWEDIVSTALVGTQRLSLKLQPPDNALGEVFSRLDNHDTESFLLALAGVLSLYQRAGQLPAKETLAPPGLCDMDDLPCCNTLAGQYLAQILAGKYVELLPEWLTVARTLGKLIPPECLPELLTLGKNNSDLRAAIFPLLGKRGLWLAKQNPEWGYFLTDNADEIWLHGDSEQRRSLLQLLRITNPDTARDRLEKTWRKESVEDRLSFLQLFSIGLSMNDEPFLEAVLDDRRKQVRDLAAKLLCKLPESRLVERTILRIRRLLELKQKEIQVYLPRDFTREMSRDGIDEVKYIPELGREGSVLFQMLSYVPPSFWCDLWTHTPEELVQLASENKSERLLILGWARATLVHLESDWAEAILNFIAASWSQWRSQSELIEGLLGILSEAQREVLISKYLPSQPDITGKNTGYELLCLCKFPWSEGLTRTVLQCLSAAVVSEIDSSSIPFNSFWKPGLLNLFPYYMAPSLAKFASSTLSLDEESFWHEPVDRFLGILQFRNQMIEALRSD